MSSRRLRKADLEYNLLMSLSVIVVYLPKYGSYYFLEHMHSFFIFKIYRLLYNIQNKSFLQRFPATCRCQHYVPILIPLFSNTYEKFSKLQSNIVI